MVLAYKSKLMLSILSFLFFFGSACVTTKPNIPVSDPIPELAYIEQRNPLLATELRKLPEIQDGLSAEEREALGKISQLYRETHKNFDTTFEEMYQVGLPEHRKYCSPLQALFWLIEDGKDQEAKIAVLFYSLEELLEKSWAFSEKRQILTENDVETILSYIKDFQIRGSFELRSRAVQDADFLKIIQDDVNDIPDIFDPKIYSLLEEITQRNKNEKRKHEKRWSDFDTVIARLNSPKLIDFYIKNNITYNYASGKTRSSKSVFEKKRGDCDDLASFGYKALTKAGYKAFGRRVFNGPGDGHIGCAIRPKTGGYMLVINFRMRGNTISGPYNSILDIDKALGFGTRYSKRTFLIL